MSTKLCAPTSIKGRYMKRRKGDVCPTDEHPCFAKECVEKGCISYPPDSSYSELIENPGVLDKAQKLVDGRDKADHYGPPEDFMRRLAKMWGGYLDQELKPTDAAMMMALLKAARLRTNPEHEDSLVDFAGYARIYERVK